MKHSVLSLCHIDVTQDHEEQEDRSNNKNNRTEYLGPKNFGVHIALFSFSAETNRKRCEACNFLSIWLEKLNFTAQA